MHHDPALYKHPVIPKKDPKLSPGPPGKHLISVSLKIYIGSIIIKITAAGIAMILYSGRVSRIVSIDDEYQIMKTHAQKGFELLEDVHIVEDLAVGAGFHHERMGPKGVF